MNTVKKILTLTGIITLLVSCSTSNLSDYKPAIAPSVENTTWKGHGNKKKLLILYFKPKGILHYKSPTGFFKNATWKQTGNTIYFETNKKYAEYSGTIVGHTMKGKAHNVVDLKWTWKVQKTD